MIGKLQEGAGKAAEVMRNSRQLAQQTVEQTGQAETALNKIRSEVTAINDMNAQIASASEEQSAVAEEVNQNINRIHNATLETSAGSEQVAASSRELTTLGEPPDRQGQLFNCSTCSIWAARSGALAWPLIPGCSAAETFANISRSQNQVSRLIYPSV